MTIDTTDLRSLTLAVLDLIDRTDKAEADAQHHEANATRYLEQLHRLALLADPWILNDHAANAATYEQVITDVLRPKSFIWTIDRALYKLRTVTNDPEAINACTALLAAGATPEQIRTAAQLLAKGD